MGSHGEKEEETRFIVDGMLGSLARWLRILGYDAAYDSRHDDPELARIAAAEGRVLLTRDVQLSRRRGIRALLVESQRLDEQLAQVVGAFGLCLDGPFGRCSLCNEALDEVTHDDVRDEVPPYVLQTQSRFMRCPSCGKIYWRGTHWHNMRDRLGRFGGG